MNKIWSIILIVVASTVVLGGTYWYFGMQKPKAQEESTPSALVVPAQAQPPVTKDIPSVAPSPKTEPPLPKQEEKPAAKPASAEPAQAEVQKDTPPIEAPKQMKRLPAPVAPAMTKDGGFALPSFGKNGEKATAKSEMPTSVLASEELPAKAEVSPLQVKQETSPLPATPEGEAIPVIEEPVKVEEEELQPIVQEAEPGIASAESQEIQVGEKPEEMKADSVGEVAIPPMTEEPVEAMPEVVLEEPVEAMPEVVLEEPAQAMPEVVLETPAPEKAPPPAVKILRSETVFAEEEVSEDKQAIEANVSVSFLDYNVPRTFTSSEKSFTVSVDVMSRKEMFGWGGTLEFGKYNTSGIVQISLLGKAEWKLGKDVVNFPLSISFGPALFINSTANAVDFGMKGKLSAGVTYAISDSFRMFYEVGVGATYNFTSPSFRFVMEPIRVGIGFSF